MSSLWVIVVFVVLTAGVMLVLAARRTHDEITPTVEAFERFRKAITPAVASLATETAAARRRLDHGATEIGDPRRSSRRT